MVNDLDSGSEWVNSYYSKNNKISQNSALLIWIKRVFIRLHCITLIWVSFLQTESNSFFVLTVAALFICTFHGTISLAHTRVTTIHGCCEISNVVKTAIIQTFWRNYFCKKKEIMRNLSLIPVKLFFLDFLRKNS